jgi:Aromatic-ring-opening dioxygenase LigAB, LigA subunit
MNPQLEGIDTIPGTYLFDILRSVKSLKLNRFFWNLARTEYRELFIRDEEEAYARAGLSEEERMLTRARDWLGLIRYGANFFVLEKFARVLRMSNMQVYAIMRGESYEDFLKTRRVPDAQ